MPGMSHGPAGIKVTGSSSRVANAAAKPAMTSRSTLARNIAQQREIYGEPQCHAVATIAVGCGRSIPVVG